MAKPKSITIKLTPNQRTQLRSLTGEDLQGLQFEAVQRRAGKLPARTVGRKFTLHLDGTGDPKLDSSWGVHTLRKVGIDDDK